MTENPILIRNVYYMLAYAFRAISSDGTHEVEGESFTRIHDLFAEILLRGVGSQVKRGLHRDYRMRSEEMATVRGRIDIATTAASRSTLRGRLVCEFDEYVVDTPHNRALKSVIILLIRHGDVERDRRDGLRRLLPYLEEVTHIAPSEIRWSTLTYHRANATYRLLLGVCELVVRGLLATQQSGDLKLRSWVADEEMSRLYERFLLEYFKHHHPELSPASRKVPWDLDDAASHNSAQLPEMRTDLMLQSGHRTLIIDAKYYTEAQQTGHYGKGTVRSAHLYQMFAYAKNADTEESGNVSALLLYAQTSGSRLPDLDVTIQGTRLTTQTLDLSAPWELLRHRLDGIADEVRAPDESAALATA